jgi:hypothetical protein
MHATLEADIHACLYQEKQHEKVRWTHVLHTLHGRISQLNTALAISLECDDEFDGDADSVDDLNTLEETVNEEVVGLYCGEREGEGKRGDEQVVRLDHGKDD